MDNSNNQKVIALILCLFLFFVYSQTVMQPYFESLAGVAPAGQQVAQPQATTPAAASPQAPATTAPAQAVAATAADGSVPQTPGAQANPAQAGPPSDVQVKDAGVIRVRNTLVEFEISKLGGRVTELGLVNYDEDVGSKSGHLNLIKHAENARYPLGVLSGGVSDENVRYNVKIDRSVATESEAVIEVNATARGAKITLEGALPDSRLITKTFTFTPDSYFVDIDVKLSNPAPDGSPVELGFTEQLVGEVGSFRDYRGFVYFDGEKAQRELFTDMDEPNLSFGNARWVAVNDNYFASTLMIGGEDATPARAVKRDTMFEILLASTPTGGSYRLYSGPKSYELLQSLGYELDRLIDFGWTGFISAPLLLLLHWFYGVLGNYGLAIVGLTILVKWVLFPLNSASYKQMKAMQNLQPELKRIREQIPDKQQQQTALMELYKKKGVNPFGGCFPMLLQLPIFIGLYYGLLVAIELRHAPFAFWIEDLSAPEALMVGGFAVPVMVILMVVSMLVQQWTTPSAMDPVQKKTMLVIPIVFGFMFATFPAGLTLYWLTSNLISIGQQKGLQSEGKASPVKVTAIVSLVVFTLCWILTLAG